MWEVGEVAGGEDSGPSNVVSLRQCVEQFECILEEAAFAICVNESFGERMVFVDTGFNDLCVEFLGNEWVLSFLRQREELRFEGECIGREKE